MEGQTFVIPDQFSFCPFEPPHQLASDRTNNSSSLRDNNQWGSEPEWVQDVLSNAQSVHLNIQLYIEYSYFIKCQSDPVLIITMLHVHYWWIVVWLWLSEQHHLKKVHAATHCGVSAHSPMSTPRHSEQLEIFCVARKALHSAVVSPIMPPIMPPPCPPVWRDVVDVRDVPRDVLRLRVVPVLVPLFPKYP